MQRLPALSAALAALVLCALPAPVSAQTKGVTKQTRVNVRDLDLRNPQDLNELNSRIEQAVAYVCDLPPRFGRLPHNDSCVTDALAFAKPQVDTAVLQARRGIAMVKRESWAASNR